MVRLRTVSPSDPGWTRRRAGKGFVYLDQLGVRLPPEDRERCVRLVIPPAWEEVWICQRPNGHLQAVGTDAAGRRQYLYHPEWRRKRDESKHDRVLEVAGRLPRARRRVAVHLQLDGMPYERALATAFRLLDLGFFRIGGETYAEANHSYGLATIRKEHVTVENRDRRVRLRRQVRSGAVRRAGRRPRPRLRRRSPPAPQRWAGAAGLQGRPPLEGRHLDRHQRLREGAGRRRGVGQGLPHLARHGDRRGRPGRGQRGRDHGDRAQAGRQPRP